MSTLRAGTQAAVRIGTALSPLATIELAASRLLRESATPAVHALARTISEAVQEIDAELASALLLLDATPIEPHAEADALPALRTLVRRATAALAAREIELRAALEAEAAWPGDPDLLAMATSLMVRIAAGQAGRGGRCELALQARDERRGVVVRWRAAPDQACGPEHEGEAGPRLHALAARCGCVVEEHVDDDAGEIGWWTRAAGGGAR